MGKTRAAVGLSDAPRGRAPGGLVARSGLRRFLDDRAGATAIEYAIIASLMVAVLIAGLITVGPKLSTIFGNVSNGFG